MKIQLDLNTPKFQEQWFQLNKTEQLTVLRSLRKISQLHWEQLYSDKGLKWELVHSKQGRNGGKLYSFRLGKAFRALATREGSWLCPLSLHPDHDSAY